MKRSGEQYLCRCVNCDYQAALEANSDLTPQSTKPPQIPITNIEN